MPLSDFRSRSAARRIRARHRPPRRRRSGRRRAFPLAIVGGLIGIAFVFRLALVLQKGGAGYAVLLQPLRERGATAAALAEILAPDPLTLAIAAALAPLI